MTHLDRRTFLTGAAALGVASCGSTHAPASPAASHLASLPNLAASAKPITPEEMQARIARAQAIMQQRNISALIIESGSSLVYFTGLRWGRSERFTGAVIPREGDIAIVTPAFEEPSVRETLAVGNDVRIWQEDESPFARVAQILTDRKLAGGDIAFEETVRNFIRDGVATAAPAFRVVAGEPVTRGVRMIKSPAELALMQTANDITLAAYKHIHPRIEAGMNALDISTMMSTATRDMGGAVEFSMVLLNEASAYPHGTRTLQTVREGSVILMDCGCGVYDYESDISRTWIFGEPTEKQRKVWNTVKRGQEIALETAKVGTPAGEVDAAVRRYYESLGYGPGYKTPGLSHRTGHGIGMDGHEPVNLVRNETTPLAPGMCFSNEPGIYEFGAFGVRLEDCFHMTDAGPVLFSPLSPSIDKPFG
jgi:Xaa-Pro dipeptidase